MTSPEDARRSQLRNIEVATGRTVAQWAESIAAAGLDTHGKIMTHLKSEHGFTHGNANGLALAVRELWTGGPASHSALLDAQYSGAKASLRPVYQVLVDLAAGLGTDVEIAVKKSGVSLRRRKQFALIEVPSAKRVQLGLNLAGVAAGDRLKAASGMCTNKVDLTDPGDVDQDVTSWMTLAYDQAG